jgi:hypothetical protein
VYGRTALNSPPGEAQEGGASTNRASRSAAIERRGGRLQIDHPTLGVRVALDVALRGRQRRMARKLLYVPERTAGRNDVLGATSDERAPAAERDETRSSRNGHRRNFSLATVA